MGLPFINSFKFSKLSYVGAFYSLTLSVKTLDTLYYPLKGEPLFTDVDNLSFLLLVNVLSKCLLKNVLFLMTARGAGNAYKELFSVLTAPRHFR